MASEFGAVDEIVERLVRSLLAGEEEIVAVVRELFHHALAGEKIVAQIHGTQGLQARAVLLVPAFDGVALAVLFLGPSGASGTTLECPGATTVAHSME